ncbi:hypothetical protein [Novosphingobium naphthalenivorans]|uniref:hypothetical protein n=1 Tax=Novosphingobium naphthalenivorans TaxID=273168 RepID=UPI00082A2FB3|nr:hypothetical protein [Novosphingobium naphthalenivorans]
MAHLYEVHANDGQAYNVTTPHHHDDHDDQTFRKHLLDVVKSTISGVAANAINRYIYKGRR